MYFKNSRCWLYPYNSYQVMCWQEGEYGGKKELNTRPSFLKGICEKQAPVK